MRESQHQFSRFKAWYFSLCLEVTVAVVTSSQCYINDIELNLQIKKIQSEYKLDSLKILSAHMSRGFCHDISPKLSNSSKLSVCTKESNG